MQAGHPLKLRSYWTEVHQIYTQYSQIITDELVKNQNNNIGDRKGGKRKT